MNSSRGSITLGDLVGKIAMLEIACSKCDRRGLRRLDRLIEEHGAGIGLPVLGEILAGDCPKARTVSINDRCGVNFPQLPDLFMKPRGPEGGNAAGS
jgi:hypothetical protein